MKKKCNLSILTTARERMKDPWQYVNETIWQVQAQDQRPVQNFSIFCAGQYGGIRPDGWGIYENLRIEQGNTFPYWEMLSCGALFGGELIALEDDINLCAGAVKRMAATEIPYDRSWVQFFTPRHITKAQGPGVWSMPRGSSQFNQAIKFSHDALIRLTHSNLPAEWFTSKKSDEALAIAAKFLELDYAVHYPDLVEHVGEISQATPANCLKPHRKTGSFRSREWDCNAKLNPADYFEVK